MQVQQWFDVKVGNVKKNSLKGHGHNVGLDGEQAQHGNGRKAFDDLV